MEKLESRNEKSINIEEKCKHSSFHTPPGLCEHPDCVTWTIQYGYGVFGGRYPGGRYKLPYYGRKVYSPGVCKQCNLSR